MRRAYGMLCSIVGIALNVCLFAGKYLAGVISGSIAITAEHSTTVGCRIIIYLPGGVQIFRHEGRCRTIRSDTVGSSMCPASAFL